MSSRQRTRPKQTNTFVPGNFAPLPHQPLAPAGGSTGLVPQGAPGGLARQPGQYRPRRLLGLDTLGGQFNALALVAILAALLALVVSFTILGSVSANFRNVVNSATSSIAAADDLAQSINAMDTAAAELLVAARLDNGTGDASLPARQLLQNSRPLFTDALFRARSNTSTPAEVDAINLITNSFYDYIGRLAVMRSELEQGRRDNALAQYKIAHDILVGNPPGATVTLQNGRTPEEIMRLNNWNGLSVDKQYLGVDANIARLAKINQDELTNSREATLNTVRLNFILVVVSAVVVVAALLLLSVRYAVITHRVLNPGFALALVLATGMLILLATTLGQAESDYRVLSSQSFDSINAASQARQLVFDMQGDEARLLLASPDNPANSAAPAQPLFNAKTLEENFQSRQAILAGILKQAWSNVNFAGERQALCQITGSASSGQPPCSDQEKAAPVEGRPAFALDDYLQQHKSVMDLYNRGSIADAVKLNLGTSTQAANRIEKNLDGLAQVNKTNFDKAACSTIGTSQFGTSCQGEPGYLNLLQAASFIILPCLALFTFAGAWFARRLF